MRTSSKIMLAACAALLLFLLTVYLPRRNASRPDITEQDARTMLTDLADAFERKSVSDVLSFAAPDAKVAGRELTQIRALLQRGFQYVKNPHVAFQDVRYTRSGETVSLRFTATLVDQAPGSGGSETIYSQPVGCTVQRITVPQLAGLLTTYDWKITDVDAPRLPDEGGV